MNLNEFINLGIKLEETISTCYECLEGLSSDQTVSWRLNKMAQEEKNHADILRSGKKYIKLIPDAFGVPLMTVGEIKTGLRKAQGLLRTIRQTSNLEDGLKTLLELERQFEKVHLDTSIEIRDPSLKKLFQDLSQADKTHTQSLEEIISSG
jgi:rubrerythrin